MASSVVASVDEIPPGGRKIVEVAGRSIAVFNLDGEFFALRNRCPHQGGPLCEGQTLSALTADRPGEYRRTRPGELVRCPWHGWEFDIRTGQSWFDPERRRVRRYPVEVRSGRRLTQPAAGGPRHVKGPYVAETVPVSIEGSYVLVELGPEGSG